MRFLPAAVLAPLFTLLSAVPCHAQLFSDSEARRRVDVLQQQLAEQNRLIEERMSKVEKAVAGASDRSAMLDLSSQIEALRNDIAKMRGQLEVATNQIEVADKRQKDLYLDIDTRIRKLEQANEQQAAAAAAAAAAGTQGQPGGSPAESQQAGEMRAYQAALDQFKLGNYPLAVSAMQGFLVTYPNSTLAPNAQYWIGMAHSGQRDYKNAIAAQRKLLASWPESEKAPDAPLSIASSQETMGDRKNAQKTLEEVIQRYPKSSAAQSAKQRLAASKRG
ncbi:MAG TPA: tol-pal system protein YbgF [Burkholderiales bacterium]